MSWHLLVLSLPTGNATVRMRAWRALRHCGAVVLRDGVYVLPGQDHHAQALQAIAADVHAHQGLAHVLHADQAPDEIGQLFSRSEDFQALQAESTTLLARLPADSAQRLRAARQLRKRFEQLARIDFFPDQAQDQARQALQRLEAAVARADSPDEPVGTGTGEPALPRLRKAQHQGRTWATRRRPGIDRLACAWLIRRFIDQQARFLWLARPVDCPADALGYDFDGAVFSHHGTLVTFQVLAQRFGLDGAALHRLGLLVQALDTGGPLPPEAVGVEAVLGGMRAALADDEQLRLASAGVFEGLFLAFEHEAAAAPR